MWAKRADFNTDMLSHKKLNYIKKKKKDALWKHDTELLPKIFS